VSHDKRKLISDLVGRIRFIIHRDAFRALAIPSRSHRLPSLSVRAGTPSLSPRIGASAAPSLKCLYPWISAKNNVAKGDCRDEGEGWNLSKGGLEEQWKMYKRTDAGRFVSWNGVAPFSVAKKSSRTSCISFFPSSLGRVTSYTRETHTGWLKTDRC